MNNVIICCSCNGKEKYVNYLLCLLKSINVNTPDINIHVRLVNCNESVYRRVKKFKNVYIQNDIFLNDNKTHISSLGSHLNGNILNLLSKYRNEVWGIYNTEAFYTCMVKYNTIGKLLKKYQTVIYVDVDTIVRKNIIKYIDELKNYDICLYFDKEKKDFPHAGLIITNSSIKTIKLMKFIDEHFIKCIQTNNIKMELGDGDLLYDCINKSKLSCLRLHKKWKDEGYIFDTKSLMWSGRSERKTKSKTYIAEYKKYNEY